MHKMTRKLMKCGEREREREREEAERQRERERTGRKTERKN